jgi:virginiamycin B lyase
VTEFPLPDREARPHAVAAGPDGSCWYTAWATHRLGRVAASGEMTEYDLPAGCREPHGLAVHPDGAVWVAAESGQLVRAGAVNGRMYI